MRLKWSWKIFFRTNIGWIFNECVCNFPNSSYICNFSWKISSTSKEYIYAKLKFILQRPNFLVEFLVENQIIVFLPYKFNWMLRTITYNNGIFCNIIALVEGMLNSIALGFVLANQVLSSIKCLKRNIHHICFLCITYPRYAVMHS